MRLFDNANFTADLVNAIGLPPEGFSLAKLENDLFWSEYLRPCSCPPGLNLTVALGQAPLVAGR